MFDLFCLPSLRVSQVPNSWIWTPGAQYRSWLNTGRPNSYWLTGFFNPQGFLTAMKQEVTRMHKAQQWALDDVVYYTEVSEFERVEAVRAPPKEVRALPPLVLPCVWRGWELRNTRPPSLSVPLSPVFINPMCLHVHGVASSTLVTCATSECSMFASCRLLCSVCP